MSELTVGRAADLGATSSIRLPERTFVGYDIRVMKYPSGYAVECREVYKEKYFHTWHKVVNAFVHELDAIDFAKRLSESGKDPFEGELVWSNKA